MNSQQTVKGGAKEKKNLVKQHGDSDDQPKPGLKRKSNVNSEVPIRKGEYLNSSLPETSKALTGSRSRRRQRGKGNAANRTQNVTKGTEDIRKIPSNLTTDTNDINPNSLRHYRIPKRRRVNSNGEPKVNDSTVVKRHLEAAVACEPPKNRPHQHEQEKKPPSFTKDRHINRHPLPATAVELINDDKHTQNLKRNYIAKEELHNTPDVTTDKIENKNNNKTESDSYQNKSLRRVLKAKKSEPRFSILATSPVVKSVLKSKATLDLKHNDTVIQKATTFPADSSRRTEQHGTSSRSSCSSISNKDVSINQLAMGAQEMAGKDFGNPIMDMVADTSYSFPCDRDNKVDAMDVDILPTLIKQQLLVIADTNVWIDNQDSINQLLHLEYHPGARPHLIIPWMVLQEIDFNIHRDKSSSKFNQFRSASKFIHGLLSSKTPNVKGEKAAEAIIGKEFNELMADDSILNCAIQYNKNSQYVTVFITNDVNLLNKSLVHNITSFKPDKELLNNVKQLFSETVMNNTSVDTNATQIGSFASPLVSTSAHETPFYRKEADIVMDIDDPMDGNCSGSPQTPSTLETNAASISFEDVVDSVKKALTNIIIPKMVEDYGDAGWKDALKILPPYTVESALKCIDAHWIAVFQFLFRNNHTRIKWKSVLYELLQVFHNKPEPCNVIEWRITVCKTTLVLLSMDEVLHSRQRVSDACNILQSYLKCNT